MSWVRVPPEAADFSQKSLPQVSLNCVVMLCILEGVSKFVYHTSVKIIKNEIGYRDDTVPKTIETRRHCEED